MIDTLELFQSDDLGNKGLGVGPVSSGLESPIPYFDPWIVWYTVDTYKVFKLARTTRGVGGSQTIIKK